ncbi:HNH endonuclease [Prevotella sp. E15-22]|uniref:HNH endonuclease n=1 Tax=Prevotella sp. E15-22 TaxID=2937774 RepID=UPI002063EE52|nr:HNH endonuclease signature motif containing protein [Prevotella sp. E15-22]UPS45573.1 HNH endonuclease [Prevotella sp. E15-22]
MSNNRTWIAFANESICNHRKAIEELGFVSWTTNVKSKFKENDIVYLFMNDDRAIRFKLRVDKVNVPREDSKYWIDPAPNDDTYRLVLVEEYRGNLLDESVLERVGFNGGGSILTPNCNNTTLIKYVDDVFELARQNIQLPSHYIVVDLDSGAYWKNNTGHEVFNLEPNDVDGRFYGYLPPYDNPKIENLGASASDEYVDRVMVVYVKKIPNSTNRQLVAFADNARIYAKPQSGKNLNRFIPDNGKIAECTYTIESDYIYDLRKESNPFVFDVSGEDLQMFRYQRFYTGRRPKQEVKMLKWLINYLQGKVREEDEDFDFQNQVQDSEVSATLSDTAKQQPSFNNGSSGKTVAKKAYISKQALKEAHFKCVFNNSHDTFVTKKGVPYMEGHHLIPCTVSNVEHYWTKFGRNIDCVENIICLCPTCHRRIHFGSKEEKETIIKALYQKQISSLKAAGIDISLEELFSLYDI